MSPDAAAVSSEPATPPTGPTEGGGNADAAIAASAEMQALLQRVEVMSAANRPACPLSETWPVRVARCVYLLALALWFGSLVGMTLAAITVFMVQNETDFAHVVAGDVNQAIFRQLDHVQLGCLTVLVIFGGITFWTTERGWRRLASALIAALLVFVAPTQTAAGQRMQEQWPTVRQQIVDAGDDEIETAERTALRGEHVLARNLMTVTFAALAGLIALTATRRMDRP